MKEATRALKLFVQQLMDFSISIRPTTYSINYLPEDVSNFKCGIESLSPYVFENFQGFFSVSYYFRKQARRTIESGISIYCVYYYKYNNRRQALSISHRLPSFQRVQKTRKKTMLNHWTFCLFFRKNISFLLHGSKNYFIT